MISHSDDARSVSSRTILPRAVRPLEIDQVPVAFRGYEGAAQGAKSAFPVIECLLHLWDQVRARLKTLS